MPLFQKALHPDINPDIAKFLNSEMSDISEHFEKDKVKFCCLSSTLNLLRF